jgi:hypothetical protein
MKKLFQLVVIIMIAAHAPEICKAQLTGKRYFWGGSFELSSKSKTSTSNSETTTLPGEVKIGFSPEFGYMLNDRWALMAGIGYSSTITETGNDQSRANPTIMFNPGVRRFLFSEWGGLFIDGGMEFSFITFQTKSGNTTSSHSATRIFGGFGLGAAFFLNDRLMLTGKFGRIGFDSYTNKEGANYETQENNLLFVIKPGNISFGLNYFF